MVPERGKCRGERLIEWSQREGSAEGRREAQRPKTKRSQREGSAEGRGSENGPREREVQRVEAWRMVMERGRYRGGRMVPERGRYRGGRMVPERGRYRGEKFREWSWREGGTEGRSLENGHGEREGGSRLREWSWREGGRHKAQRQLQSILLY